MNKIEIQEYIKKVTDAYSEESKALKDKYNEELRKECVPYAEEHAKYKVGDILMGDLQMILVKRIGARIDIKNNDVIIVYNGKPLNSTYHAIKGVPNTNIEEKDVTCKVK